MVGKILPRYDIHQLNTTLFVLIFILLSLRRKKIWKTALEKENSLNCVFMQMK